MSESGGLAISGPTTTTKAEKVNPVETMEIDSTLLLAAEIVAEKTGVHPYLNGVYLHVAAEKKGRVVGFDGRRAFIGSFDLEAPVPSWLHSGVILLVDGLKSRIKMLVASQDKKTTVRLSHVKGHGYIEMSDLRGDAVFKIGRVARDYPDYERLIGPNSFAALDKETGHAQGNEWKPIGFNSAYLKSCSEVAKTLDDGLPKAARSKEGMTVRAFNAAAEAPMIFDFSSWPGAIMVLMPVKLANPQIAPDTMKIIGRATKLTLAALRAHVTRNIAWAEATDDEEAAAEFRRKAAGFEKRISDILNRAPDVEALPQPEPEPESEREPDGWDTEAPEPQPEPQPEPTPEPSDTNEKPAITRTKIKVGKKA